MSEVKDPAIKLFGKTIQLPDISVTAPAEDSDCGDDAPPHSIDTSVGDASIQHNPCSPDDSLPEDTGFNRSEAEQDTDKDSIKVSGDNGKAEDVVVGTMMSEELTESNTVKENSEAVSANNLEVTPKASKTEEEEQNETGNAQDKTPKKPDKIIPCPRCNSMDTKFCYYNNYNVNQPRHFCKNCQRYWTAGGTMRNVPVGAGRRKNKNSMSQYRHITVSETLHTARPDVPNGIHHPALKSNGTVLTFGSDAPLCESMASVLNIAEKTVRNSTRNGFHNGEELRAPHPYGTGGNVDEHSSGSSVTVSSSKDEVGKNGMSDNPVTNIHSIPHQITCYTGAPWPYPWNSFQWSSPAPPPPAAFCAGSFAMPLYPAAPYWGCTVPGSWNVPWVNPCTASQSQGNPTSSGPNSPTLGKHSRDDNVQKSVQFEKQEQKESNPEKCLWVPKTLRIDDPGEAARSSIWATLGIKNDKLDPSSGGGGGLFKSFQSKGDEKSNNVAEETSTALQANPAAMSRSLSFHESS